MPNELLKHLSPAAESKLLELLNMSWTRAEVPASWRVAHIVTIPKRNKPTSETGSYRPILLLLLLLSLPPVV